MPARLQICTDAGAEIATLSKHSMNTLKVEANIRDVASQAGVSIGTVSRVLRGEEGVRIENVERVQQAVAVLGYTNRGRGRNPREKHRPRNRNGTLSAGRKTGNLGLYVPNASSEWAHHPLCNSVFRGLDRACGQSGYHYLSEFSEPSKSVPRMIAEGKIDGLIIKGESTPWIAEGKTNLPIVGVNLHQLDLPFDQVNCDDFSSGYLGAEYLWKHGHRRIAFVSNVGHHPLILMRSQGYEHFLRMHRGFDADLICIPDTQQPKPSRPQVTFSNFEDLMRQWQNLPGNRRPTAILAANDWTAAGIYQSAEHQGVCIPLDLSILSFDNNAELCCLLKPKLSSFKVTLEQATYLAAMRLIQKIDYNIDDHNPIIQSALGELVVRDSIRELTATQHRCLHELGS